MQVGDLIRWENRDNEYELGVVTKVRTRDALVWFFADHGYSIMSLDGLEVINASR